MELYNQHRPKDFVAVVGNEQNITILKKWAEQPPNKRPHNYMFVGNTGCGKTTLALIYAKMLGCEDANVDLFNVANFRGIDMARDIMQRMQRKPTGKSKCRVFIFEEAHGITKDAQEALLKPTEDTPKHVYFIFTTTAPEKMIGALKGRMKVINVTTLEPKQLIKIMQRVVKREKEEVDEKILAKIAERSMFSARIALNTLEMVLALPAKDRKNFETIIDDTQSQAIDLCRALMKRPRWADLNPLLKSIKGDAEGIRWAVLGYADACLMGGNMEAYNIMLAFEQNYFNTGHSGLTKSCYEYVFGTDPIKQSSKK